MPRHIFGGEIANLVVSEDAGNADALVRDPNTAVPFYDEPGGTLVDDFLLQDLGGEYTVEATVIESTATAHLPWFQGPDGARYLYTPADPEDIGGLWLRLDAVDLIDDLDTRLTAAEAQLPGEVLTSYVDQVAVLPDYPTTFPPADHTHGQYATSESVSDALATLDGEKADLAHTHDDRYYTEDEVDALIEGSLTGAIQILGIFDPGEEPAPGSPDGLYAVRLVDTGGGGGGGGTPDVISFVGVDFPDGTSSLSTATATIPAAVEVGDLMLAFWSTAGPSATVGYTDPSGWTPVGSGQDIGSSYHQRLYYRFAQAGDAGSAVTGTLTTGASRQTMGVIAFRNVLQIDGFAYAAAGGAATAHTTPSVTTVAEDCVVVAFAGDRSADGLTTWTATGLTEAGESNRTGTGGKTAVVGYDLTQVTSGTDVGGDTFTSSVSTSNVGKWTVALAPTLS